MRIFLSSVQKEFKLPDGFVATIWRPMKSSTPPFGTKPAPSGTKLGLSPDQVEILRKCLTPSAILDLMEIANRSDRTKFRNQVLRPLLEERLVEMTIPDRPTSSKQQYRTTEAGRSVLERLEAKGDGK